MSCQPSLGFVILYVNSPESSSHFYQKLLGLKPIKASPTFVMFRLSNGVFLGLWDKSATQPPVHVPGGAVELNFPADDVDAVHAEWGAQGITILQKPSDMDFGRSFVASDPDGHRIRVYRLKG